MFCEKCGVQIPDGGDTMCPNCRLRFGTQPNFGKPVQPMGQPVHPTAQPYQQPAAAKAESLLNKITGNPMIALIINLTLAYFSVFAAFGPLLEYIGYTKTPIAVSFMTFAVSGATGGFFVPILILMIFSIILAVAGVGLVILPKVAPQIKLPVPSFTANAAIAGALLFSIISQFITIGFIGTARGVAVMSFLGVFVMVLSFIGLAASCCMAFAEMKKK